MKVESLRNLGVDIESECPSCLFCPITCTVMTNPVLAMDGYCYERTAIRQWIEEHGTSPKTNAKLSARLIPTLSLRAHIWSWVDEKAKQMTDYEVVSKDEPEEEQCSKK